MRSNTSPTADILRGLLFGGLFSKVTRIPGFDTPSYLDYLVPGVVVMRGLFGCGWSGMSLIEDLDRSIIDRYLTTPVHRSAIIGGLTVYQLVTLVVQAVIIAVLALVLGARFAGGIVGFVVFGGQDLTLEEGGVGLADDRDQLPNLRAGRNRRAGSSSARLRPGRVSIS